MKHLAVTKATINPARLDADLRAALGAAIAGFSHAGATVTVHFLVDTPDPADEAMAAQIVDAHDPAALTAEQARVELARAYLAGVDFAARAAAIEASTLGAGTKTVLKAINRTEWALAVAVLGAEQDAPAE